MADQINHIIKLFELKYIKIPKKYLIKFPMAEDSLIDKNYAVIAEKIDTS
jgi:hypothetical protein